MEFIFQNIPYHRPAFVEDTLPMVPKCAGVYKIFDLYGKLIVLDKTSSLYQRLDRFYGHRPEMHRDLDLREITERIEFRRTDSPFETLYLLYRERRHYFPKTYRRMRTFRLFPLMKINPKQRFPRIYSSRQIKPGVDYFGPFTSRGQFTRLKTALERTFKLRPCVYNIRGGDPHPDCMYFQMRTCSRPCNNDIDRSGYLDDVRQAIAFIQGHDQEIENSIVTRMNALAEETKFEEAELVRRRLEKVRNVRKEGKDTFFLIRDFNYVIILPAGSASRCKAAFVREGSILGFEQYDTASLGEKLESDIGRIFTGPLPQIAGEYQYDEFCLVCHFLLNPLESVKLIPLQDVQKIRSDAIAHVARRKSRRESRQTR